MRLVCAGIYGEEETEIQERVVRSDRAGPCPGTEHVQRWKDGWLWGREKRLGSDMQRDPGPWCRDLHEHRTGEVAAEMPGTLEASK